MSNNHDEHMEKYLEAIRASYADWCRKTGDKPYEGNSDPRFSLSVVEGTAYWKVMANHYGQNSVHSFVCRKPGKFAMGEILKAASFNTPAKNFSRGNIYLEKWPGVAWTGIS